MIRHLSKRERWIAILTAVIISAAGLDRFAVRPLLNVFRGQISSVETRRMRLVRNLKLLAEEPELEKGYQDMVEAFSLVLTPEEEIARMLEEIERVGQGSRVEILDIKPLTVRDGEFFKTFHLDLECEGTIVDIARFLHQIGQSPRGMRVAKMRLTARRGSPKLLRASMEVSEVRLVSDPDDL